MPVPNITVFQFYEGTNPTLYSTMNGANLNQAATQLLANDVYLEGQLQTALSDENTGLNYKAAKLYTTGEVVHYQNLFYKRNSTSSASPELPSNITYWDGPYQIGGLDAVRSHEEPDYTTAVSNVSTYKDGDTVFVVDAELDPTVNNAGDWAIYLVVSGSLSKLQDKNDLDKIIADATETTSGLTQLAAPAEILSLLGGAQAMTPANLATAMSNLSQISKTSAGWYNDPFSGLQFRWDEDINVGNVGPDTLSFPIAFSNACLLVIPAAVVQGTGIDAKRIGYQKNTLTAATVDIDLDNGGDLNFVSYLAIGY